MKYFSASSQQGFSPILVILGVVLVLGLIAGAFFAGANFNKNIDGKNSPLSEDTAFVLETPQTTTFVHPNKGFSFAYPSYWSYELTAGSGENKLINFVNGSQKELTLEIKKQSLSEFASLHPAARAQKIAGREALVDEREVGVPVGGAGWSIIFTFTEEGKKDKETVLSSLVIPAQADIDPVEDWKEYHNLKFGFSLKYPALLEVKETEGVSNSGVEVSFGGKMFFSVKVVEDSKKEAVDYIEDLRLAEKNLLKTPEELGPVKLSEWDFTKYYETAVYIAMPGKTLRQIDVAQLKNGNILVIRADREAAPEGLKFNETNLVDQLIPRVKVDK